MMIMMTVASTLGCHYDCRLTEWGVIVATVDVLCTDTVTTDGDVYEPVLKKSAITVGRGELMQSVHF